MSFFGIGGPEETTTLIEGCYTLSAVPGKNIVKSFGLIEHTMKNIDGNAPKKIEAVFNNLLAAAKKKGANAVVNLQLVTGSYERQGSKWIATYIIAYGDAVVVE